VKRAKVARRLEGRGDSNNKEEGERKIEEYRWITLMQTA